MKALYYIIWIIGVALILFFSFLVSGLFEDNNVLLLDTVILIISYTLAFNVYTGLFVSQEEFTNQVASIGVKIYTVGVYCPLVLLCIIVGCAYKIPFKWQLFIQFCFLFFYVIGLVISKTSSKRLEIVENKSQARHASIDSLFVMVQKLKLAVSLNNTIDGDVQKRFSKFAERVGYISPSSSPTVILQEDMLKSSISHLASLVQANAPLDQLLKELENAETILSQRIKTY